MKVFFAMLLLLPFWGCAPGPLERGGKSADQAVKGVSDAVGDVREGVEDASKDLKRKHK
jgi:hypothetical protein